MVLWYSVLYMCMCYLNIQLWSLSQPVYRILICHPSDTFATWIHDLHYHGCMCVQRYIIIICTHNTADQGWVNSSTWYPITILELLGLMPTTDLELIMSSGGTKHGKEDPSLPHRKGGVSGVSLLISQSCITHHIDWMAGGKLRD